jgi:hypothetical protein
MGNRDAMIRPWPAVVLAVSAVATPLLLTACRDNEPSKPTITLVEPTIDPNVSVGTVPRVSG